MGRLINGILGPFRGKVGPVVGYTWKGQGVIRSLPKKISKAPSQKQLDNREKLAACQEWLKLITPFVIDWGSKTIRPSSMVLAALCRT